MREKNKSLWTREEIKNQVYFSFNLHENTTFRTRLYFVRPATIAEYRASIK